MAPTALRPSPQHAGNLPQNPGGAFAQELPERIRTLFTGKIRTGASGGFLQIPGTLQRVIRLII